MYIYAINVESYKDNNCREALPNIKSLVLAEDELDAYTKVTSYLNEVKKANPKAIFYFRGITFINEYKGMLE